MTVTFPESELRDDEVDRQILLLLAAAYQQTSSTMSEAVAISTARAWLAMGGVSTADHERFKRWWRPTLRSASKQSASLSPDRRTFVDAMLMQHIVDKRRITFFNAVSGHTGQ